MKREAPRTLYTLSKAYQKGVKELQYEVIVVDCGTEISVNEIELDHYGKEFRLLRFKPSSSPAAAINQAFKESKGQYVTICIDGARMLSPGILYETVMILAENPNAVIATFAFHLGYEIQNKAIEKGYNQETEDLLLSQVDWKADGYQLFATASPDGSSADGWFNSLSESNCITISNQLFHKAGGFDERFTSPGGGLINLDFFKRIAQEHPEIHILTGEGTFHQIHGGVSTNIPMNAHPWEGFHQEYIKIKGYEFQRPEYKSILWGIPQKTANWFLQHSYNVIFDDLQNQKKQVNTLHNLMENMYQDFEKYKESAENDRNLLINENKIMMNEIKQMRNVNAQLHKEHAATLAEVNAVLQSRSWKYTRPLRYLSEIVRRIVTKHKTYPEIGQHL